MTNTVQGIEDLHEIDISKYLKINSSSKPWVALNNKGLKRIAKAGQGIWALREGVTFLNTKYFPNFFTEKIKTLNRYLHDSTDVFAYGLVITSGTNSSRGINRVVIT